MQKNWGRIFLPCIIVAILSLIPIIMGFAGPGDSEGWSMVLVVLFLPAAIALLVLSAFIKLVFKPATVYLWLIEFLVVIATATAVKLYFL